MLLPEPFGPMMACTSPAPTVERQAVEDLLAVDLDVEVLDLEHCVRSPISCRPQPTLPSSEMPSSFLASTANSIGSSSITSRQKPLTISATASSSGMPRLRQ